MGADLTLQGVLASAWCVRAPVSLEGSDALAWHGPFHHDLVVGHRHHFEALLCRRIRSDIHVIGPVIGSIGARKSFQKSPEFFHPAIRPNQLGIVSTTPSDRRKFGDLKRSFFGCLRFVRQAR